MELTGRWLRVAKNGQTVVGHGTLCMIRSLQVYHGENLSFQLRPAVSGRQFVRRINDVFDR